MNPDQALIARTISRLHRDSTQERQETARLIKRHRNKAPAAAPTTPLQAYRKKLLHLLPIYNEIPNFAEGSASTLCVLTFCIRLLQTAPTEKAGSNVPVEAFERIIPCLERRIQAFQCAKRTAASLGLVLPFQNSPFTKREEEFYHDCHALLEPMTARGMGSPWFVPTKLFIQALFRTSDAPDGEIKRRIAVFKKRGCTM
ncbi:hypothetical protein BJ508DRAFT_313696 [Ascobolus immersus RN42]|uniref:Uncharacterized protein n=1 Tax=Ascobolus immersus RN42 TaxID=1160509 RepID=A0A3N4HNZ0_ASCIM|nr:hypothetical protein BJ508DRAFT_313696 [Ascobolus immersus RN42]